jgi:hypothetical protein
MPRLSALVKRQRYGKRPDARTNGKPRAVKITHGFRSKALMRDPLHAGTVVGKAHRAYIAALTSDLGGDLSTAERTLVEQVSRLHLIAQLAWNNVAREGLFGKSGHARPAYDAFLRTVNNQREILKVLGLQRRAKPVLSLQEYLGALNPADAPPDPGLSEESRSDD